MSVYIHFSIPNFTLPRFSLIPGFLTLSGPNCSAAKKVHQDSLTDVICYGPEMQFDLMQLMKGGPFACEFELGGEIEVGGGDGFTATIAARSG